MTIGYLAIHPDHLCTYTIRNIARLADGKKRQRKEFIEPFTYIIPAAGYDKIKTPQDAYYVFYPDENKKKAKKISQQEWDSFRQKLDRIDADRSRTVS